MKKFIIFCILIFPCISFADYFKVGTYPGNDNNIGCNYKVESIPYVGGDFIVTQTFWKAIDPSIHVNQFAVKAGNEYTLYQWDGQGTDRFAYFSSCKDVSHVSFCDKCTVPIPGAFILLASGLFGLNFIKRS